MMKQVVIDCASGARQEVELSQAEINAEQARREQVASLEAAAKAKREAILARVLGDARLRDIAVLLGWVSE